MAQTVATAPALSAQAARRIITSALASRADLARRTAASRRLSGPELAVAREQWRQHMRVCRELADRMSAIDPDGLARLLAGRPELCPQGCGCRIGTDDADRFECGCDGPCTGAEVAR